MEENHPKGKNHVSVQAGRDVSGSIHIGHVGDVYAPSSLGITYSLEKTLGTLLHVASVQKAAGWTAVISLLGIVADILSVINFFGGSWPVLPRMPTIVPFVFMFSMMIFILCHLLRNGTFQHLLGSWGMRKDPNKGLLFEKVSAICPICGGKVFLRNLPKGSDFQCMGMCERNPHFHAFTFDPTTMSGSHYPITYRVHQGSK